LITSICRTCGKSSAETEFQSHSSVVCKPCRKQTRALWVSANRERCRGHQRQHYQRNPDRAKQAARIWIEANRERRNRRKREIYRSSPVQRLRKQCKAVASRLKASRNESRLGLLSYTPNEFVARLQQTLPKDVTFQQAINGGWHIDHIVPVKRISELEISDNLKLRVAMDLSNLRMLPGRENMARGVGSEEEWLPILDGILIQVVQEQLENWPINLRSRTLSRNQWPS
jgi:hypothetical protein